MALDASQARQLALKRLGSREHSSAELEVYLRRKGVESQVAAGVITELVDKGLLSDERYARVMARHQSSRGKGPVYVKMKLKQKGIDLDSAEAQELLCEVTGESDLERARRVVQTRYPRAAEDQGIAAKAYQALLRRGFSFETARLAVFGR